MDPFDRNEGIRKTTQKNTKLYLLFFFFQLVGRCTKMKLSSSVSVLMLCCVCCVKGKLHFMFWKSKQIKFIPDSFRHLSDFGHIVHKNYNWMNWLFTLLTIPVKTMHILNTMPVLENNYYIRLNYSVFN